MRSSASALRVDGKRLLALLAALWLTCPLSATAQEGRIYVRRIEFEGISGIADRALRNELVQLEGAFLNTSALDASLDRLRRLPVVRDVRAQLRPVVGTHDVVDIALAIDEETRTRQYGGGGGWSESLRGSLRGYFADDNLLGTGQRLSLTAEASPLRSSIELGHTQPHAGAIDVARRVELTTRQVERLTDDASQIDAGLTSAVLEYGYPLGRAAAQGALPWVRRLAADERLLPTAEVRERLAALDDVLDELQPLACCGSLRLGVALRRADMTPGIAVSSQLLQWIIQHGGTTTDGPAIDIDEIDFLLHYTYDTRERTVFPTRGIQHRVSFTAALPGSDVEYALADYRVAAFRPVGLDFTLRAIGRLAYGTAFGDTVSMPPYLHWFAGGPLTVRGFRENALGPRDSFGNPYGGNLLFAARLELMTAWPERWRDRLRVGWFLDVGNVFSTEDVMFTDAEGLPLDYGFDTSKLARSVGLAAEVLTPFGALRLSYAVPINPDDQHPNPFLREHTERFQVSLGFDF